MKQYTHLLFDMDGTLTDSGPGIRAGICYVLQRWGLPPMTLAQLNLFIGPPMLESFHKYLGFSPEEAFRAVRCYREYYEKYGLFDNSPYEGITDVLQSAVNAGKTLLVATTKPQPFAVRILEHFDMAKYFTAVAGSNMDETRGTKHEVIEYALQLAGNPERAGVLMIGDRLHDVQGAKQSGLDCLGVLYGFGSRDELQQAGAKYIAPDMQGLQDLLQSL